MRQKRRFSRRCASIISIVAAALLPGGRAAWSDSRELFIGNSLTLTNNLPALVGQMRLAAGFADYQQSSATVFGVGLDWHWADTTPTGAHALLAPGGWDGVVLQDLSINPTDAPWSTRTYVRLWDSEIKQKAPDAVTYLFAHWERQDRAGSQPIIDSVYGGLGAELNATVVPVGDVWQRLKSIRPDIPLYIDVVHPTLRGSYAAAATFYSTFFGQSPVGLAPPAGITAADAADIQNAAWDVVSGRRTAQDRSWGGGVVGDWNDSENWGPIGLPAAGDRISLIANDGIDRVINYSNPYGASQLLGSLTISASGGSITMQQSQSTLRVGGDLVLGDTIGGRGNYELSGTGRVFAARDEQIINGAFGQHAGRHVIMQRLSIGGEAGANASYLLDGGLLAAHQIDVKSGGTFTQLGGTLNAGQFNLAGGKVQGVLHNRGVFNYSSGTFNGKLINEGTATLAFNSGKIGAAGTGAAPQMEIEVSGDGSSLVRANANQDLKSLVVDFANEGAQGFDLASGSGDGQYRLIRIFPGDASGLAAAQRGLSAAIANALINPGDGIYDSGLDGRAGMRIGIARRNDVNLGPFLLMRPTVMGDVNLDGAVTIADFIDLASHFDERDASWDMGDLNYDGQVTIADFIDQAANFGRDYSGEMIPMGLADQTQLNQFAAAHVPEPAALSVVFVGLMMGLRNQQRRRFPQLQQPHQ